MTDIAASIGIHQLRKAERFRKRREAIAARYTDAFKGLPVIPPPGSSVMLDGPSVSATLPETFLYVNTVLRSTGN